MLSLEGIIEYAKTYQNAVQNVVVSMGVKGMVGISGNAVHHVTPPKIKAGSSIGAGDSLVAGIVFALSEGSSFEEAIYCFRGGLRYSLNPESRD